MIKIPDLPFVTQDTLLNNWFPHKGEPFHVWIDKNKVVRYLISGYNSTPERVDAFIKGQSPVISDYTIDEYIETLINKNWMTDLRFGSYISHCIQGIHLEADNDSDGFIKITKNCNSVVDLYICAYNGDGKYEFNRPGRLQLEVNDSFPFIRPSDINRYDEWKKNYSYDYQLILPQNSRINSYQIMKEDLSRYFDVEAHVENKDIPCIVLIRTSSKNKLKSFGGTKENKFYQAGLRSTIIDSLRYMVNQPYERFSSKLGGIIENAFLKPFVDSTAFGGNIDIALNGSAIDSQNWQQIRNELRKYDLDLVEKKCTIPVLVLKEKCGKIQ